MQMKLLTTLLVAFATAAAASAVQAQTYSTYDDTVAEFQYGVDLDGK